MTSSFFSLIFLILAVLHVFGSSLPLRPRYREHPNRKKYQKYQAMGYALLSLGFAILGELFSDPDVQAPVPFWVCMAVAALPGLLVLWKGRKLVVTKK